jgi:hypothetical protein
MIALKQVILPKLLRSKTRFTDSTAKPKLLMLEKSANVLWQITRFPCLWLRSVKTDAQLLDVIKYQIA